MLAVILQSTAWADGKIYWDKDAKQVGLPRQRAIILHQDGMETLMVQSEISLPPENKPEHIAWVVPVPAAPAVAAPSGEDAHDFMDSIYQDLARLSHASFIGPAEVLEMLWFAGLALCCIAAGVLAICIMDRSGKYADCRMRRLATIYCRAFLLVTLGIFVKMFVSAFGWKDGGAGRDVDILQSGRVGVLDVTVVRSDKPAAMLSWLKDGGYGVVDADRAVIESYVARGWCFVATRIVTGKIDSTGLPPPLVLRFPAKDIVYPMALTGTSGHDTEVLLHVFADSPVDARGAISRRFVSDRMVHDTAHLVKVFGMGFLQPEGYFPDSFMNWRPRYLTTFKETLPPGRMRDDLVLHPEPGAKPYRVKQWKW